MNNLQRQAYIEKLARSIQATKHVKRVREILKQSSFPNMAPQLSERSVRSRNMTPDPLPNIPGLRQSYLNPNMYSGPDNLKYTNPNQTPQLNEDSRREQILQQIRQNYLNPALDRRNFLNPINR